MTSAVLAELKEADYVAAVRLGRRRSPWWLASILIVGGSVVFAAIVWWQASRVSAVFVFLATISAGLLGGFLGHYVCEPWRARRIFRQQKNLQRPYELAWDSDGLLTRNEHGQYKHHWSDFIRWREGETLFVLN